MTEITLEQRVAKIEETQLEHDDALFGRWDMREQKRTPGLVEKVNLMMWMVKIIGALVTITAAASLGLPTREIIPSVAKILLGLH